MATKNFELQFNDLRTIATIHITKISRKATDRIVPEKRSQRQIANSVSLVKRIRGLQSSGVTVIHKDASIKTLYRTESF